MRDVTTPPVPTLPPRHLPMPSPLPRPIIPPTSTLRNPSSQPPPLERPQPQLRITTQLRLTPREEEPAATGHRKGVARWSFLLAVACCTTIGDGGSARAGHGRGKTEVDIGEFGALYQTLMDEKDEQEDM
ncbi:hypothetical protein Taro_005560 [Colocasia esculenta]|uniref:Uncharacterized protein n=1 Tax=Colocasia esculenta TaxID=4460 RepID=A0A843TUV1_COLES|nr:hypothetical protein [Colocasia esculenta]